MFDLQAVVKRVTKPMGPMKKRQRAKDEQINPHQGMFDEPQRARLTQVPNPTQRESHSEQKNMNGHEQSCHYASAAEERPEKRLKEFLRRILSHASPNKKPCH